MKLSLYHVIGIATVVSISLIWVYWKVNKIERHLKDVNARVAANSSTLNNLCTSLELAKGCQPQPQVDPQGAAQEAGGDSPCGECDCGEGDCGQEDDGSGAGVMHEAVAEGEAEVEAHEEAAGDDGVPSDAEIESILQQIESEAEDVADAGVEPNVYSEAEAEAVADASYKAILHPDNWIFTEEELKKKTAEELKKYLSGKNQSVKGVKKDLIARILSLHQ